VVLCQHTCNAGRGFELSLANHCGSAPKTRTPLVTPSADLEHRRGNSEHCWAACSGLTTGHRGARAAWWSWCREPGMAGAALCQTATAGSSCSSGRAASSAAAGGQHPQLSGHLSWAAAHSMLRVWHTANSCLDKLLSRPWGAPSCACTLRRQRTSKRATATSPAAACWPPRAVHAGIYQAPCGPLFAAGSP
jgi:hypothetical protein